MRVDKKVHDMTQQSNIRIERQWSSVDEDLLEERNCKRNGKKRANITEINEK